MAGAERWAFKFEGWDLFTFGHNHYSDSRFYDRFYFSQAGKQKHRICAIVNCGTYLKAYSREDVPDYAEIAGYPPVHLGSPLIRLKLHRTPDPHTGRTITYQVIGE